MVQINEAIEDVFRSFGISDVSTILENEANALKIIEEKKRIPVV